MAKKGNSVDARDFFTYSKNTINSTPLITGTLDKDEETGEIEDGPDTISFNGFTELALTSPELKDKAIFSTVDFVIFSKTDEAFYEYVDSNEGKIETELFELNLIDGWVIAGSQGYQSAVNDLNIPEGFIGPNVVANLKSRRKWIDTLAVADLFRLAVTLDPTFKLPFVSEDYCQQARDILVANGVVPESEFDIIKSEHAFVKGAVNDFIWR